MPIDTFPGTQKVDITAQSLASIKVGDGTNVVDTVSHEGKVSQRVVPGRELMDIVHLSSGDIATTTSFMLIDLSDTTNWPHTATGHIIVSQIVFNINASTTFAGFIEIGFVDNVDATNGDFHVLYTGHEDKSSVPLAQVLDFQFFGVDLEVGEFFGPVSANDTAFQTDVNLIGPDGNASYPSGNGDMVMKITRTAGNVDVSVLVAYTTVA
jgi:hypothetical protein